MINGLNVNDEIIIYCAAGYGEQICLKFISMGYSIVGFCDNAKRNKGTFLLGLPVYDYQECRLRYPKAVYIVANSCYATALEIGMELEKDGYIKELSYYLSIELDLQGLVVDEMEGIRSVLRNKTFILFGNQFLCSLFEKWAYDLIENIELHICQREEEIVYYKKECPDAIWIPLEREAPFGDSNREELLAQLQYYSIQSFSRFFLQHMIYCEEDRLNDSSIENNSVKDNRLRIQKVVFLKTSSFSGSSFIDSILDSHPNILYLEYHIETDIWYIVKDIVKVSKEDIVDGIIFRMKAYVAGAKIKEDDTTKRIEKYRQILNKYIQVENIYSERELFIIIYLGYYELLHGTIPQGEAIIYMDIHSSMMMKDSMFAWLENMGFEIILLELIRNPLKRLGSAIKYTLGENQGTISPNTLLNLLYMLTGETVEESESKYPIIRIRFEDLKMYPKVILKRLCEICEIPWDDTFLETISSSQTSVYISNGDKVTGFDLKPVYHPYDEYFDAFDKFRLDMIFREKNKAYNYSYVEETKYPASMKEAEDLFAVPFTFEKYLSFKDEADRERFRYKMQLLFTQILFLEENKDIYKEYFQFGTYLTVEDKI